MLKMACTCKSLCMIINNCLPFLTGVDTRSHGDDMLRPLPDDSATSIRPTRERLPVTGSSTSINWSTCLLIISMGQV